MAPKESVACSSRPSFRLHGVAQRSTGRRHEGFPFIVGCPRSGTTLVRAILDSHPDLTVPSEADFVARLARSRRRYGRGSRFQAERLLGDLFSHSSFRQWSLSEREVHDAWHPLPSNFSDAIRSLYRLYASKRGKIRYGDKTPFNALHIPILAEVFSESQFVHVLRDPRDVALSWRDAGFLEPGTARQTRWGARSGADGFVEAALSWRDCLVRGRRAGRTLGVRRYYEIRYEDLVENPEREVRSLCSFLDLAFDDRMMRYYERAEDLLATIPVPRVGGHLALRLPPTSGRRAWRRTMTTQDARLVDAVAGRALVNGGYVPAGGKPRSAVALGLAWQKVRVRQRMARRSPDDLARPIVAISAPARHPNPRPAFEAPPSSMAAALARALPASHRLLGGRWPARFGLARTSGDGEHLRLPPEVAYEAAGDLAEHLRREGDVDEWILEVVRFERDKLWLDLPAHDEPNAETRGAPRDPPCAVGLASRPRTERSVCIRSYAFDVTALASEGSRDNPPTAPPVSEPPMLLLFQSRKNGSGRLFRVNEATRQLLELADGTRTVAEIGLSLGRHVVKEGSLIDAVSALIDEGVVAVS